MKPGEMTVEEWNRLRERQRNAIDLHMFRARCAGDPLQKRASLIAREALEVAKDEHRAGI